MNNKMKVLVVYTIVLMVWLLSPCVVVKAQDGSDGSQPQNNQEDSWVNPFQNWLGDNQLLNYAVTLGVIQDKEGFLNTLFWVAASLIGFVFLFLYLLFKTWVDKMAGTTFIRRTEHLWYRVQKPRNYIFLAWWLLLAPIWFVTQWWSGDPVYEKIGMQVFWIVAGMALFFTFAAWCDLRRVSDKKEQVPLVSWIWNWTVGVGLLILVSYLGGMIFGLFFYNQKINSQIEAAKVQAQEQAVSAPAAKLTIDPVKWTGPPLANLPEGLVIPAIWDPIFKREKGDLDRTARMYAIQRTECTRDDGLCISNMGALGPNQFMPDTFKIYKCTANADINNRDDANCAMDKMMDTINLFNQKTKLDFQRRFTGLDNAGPVWNFGSPNSGKYDGWGQSGIAWDNYQKIIQAANQQSQKVPVQTAAAAAPSGGQSAGGQYSITVSLKRDVPPGQINNVIIWADRNKDFSIQPGDVYDFCRETDKNPAGWGGYDFAGGYNAGGICANASMLYMWANKVPGLTIEKVFDHPAQAYPLFSKAVDCPGATLKIRNVSSSPIKGRWIHNGDSLTLELVK